MSGHGISEHQLYSGEEPCEEFLILVNAGHALAEDIPEPLVPVHPQAPSILMRSSAAVMLSRLMQDIHGWKGIVPVSGWRSREEQQAIWDSSLQENGLTFTQKYVALPGHSEHQTGLAIDLGLRQDHIDFICPEFPNTGICRLFREKASDYGFILRYPPGKEHITGISHEPWHFRYVGRPHAQIMEQEGLTLEEYVARIG